MTNRHQELTALLRTLNLSQIAARFEDVAVRAVREGRSHEAFLHELARLECEHRAEQRRLRRTRVSGLPLVSIRKLPCHTKYGRRQVAPRLTNCWPSYTSGCAGCGA